MILTCPNCGTQYAVKDGAVPPQGRQVRCAACKHSWHQDPEDSAEAGEASEPETATPMPLQTEPQAEVVEDQAETERQDEDETIAEATLIAPRSGPEAEERAYEEAIADEEAAAPGSGAEPEPTGLAAESEGPAEPVPAAALADEPADQDEFSPFADRDDQPREGGRSRLLPVLLAVIVIVAAAALFWFFAPPEWKARIGLAGGGLSPLALVTTHMDRQKLASGNELLTVSGRVINPTSTDQSVPPLQAQLKSRTGKLVYSWTIAPPARILPPGASASFNSAEVNVPAGGDELTITVGTGNS